MPVTAGRRLGGGSAAEAPTLMKTHAKLNPYRIPAPTEVIVRGE